MAPIELFDWIVNKKHVRGSRLGDNGLWVHSGTKPIFFSPKTRVVELDDGLCYVLRRDTVCKALGLDKISESWLSQLPTKE